MSLASLQIPVNVPGAPPASVLAAPAFNIAQYYLDFQAAFALIRKAVEIGVNEYVKKIGLPSGNGKLVARGLVAGFDIPLSNAVTSPNVSQLADVAWNWSISSPGNFGVPNTLLYLDLSTIDKVFVFYGFRWLSPNILTNWLRINKGVEQGPWVNPAESGIDGIFLHDQPLAVAKETFKIETVSNQSGAYTDQFAILGIVVEALGKTVSLSS